MATDLETKTLARKQSIAHIEVFCDVKMPEPSVAFQFEDALFDEEGHLFGEPTHGTLRVVRTFGEIKDKTFTTADGAVTATGAQIAEMLKGAGYAFAKEDAEARAQRAAEAEQAAQAKDAPVADAAVAAEQA